MNGYAGEVVVVDNYIDGKFVPPSTNRYMDVLNPANSQVIGKVAVSSGADVDDCVRLASQAQRAWARDTTIKQRAALMMKLHALVRRHAHELAALIVRENGKNMTEALADVAKGNETVEYACSLPQLAQGRTLQVSSEVYCQDQRQPLGVVASIVPFNFVSNLQQRKCALFVANRKPSNNISLTSFSPLFFPYSLVWFHFGPHRLPWYSATLSF